MESVKSRLASLALALCAFAFALGLAEVGMRVAGVAFPGFYRLDPDVGDALDPGAEGWWTSEGHAWVWINADGQRDVDHALAKPPGVVRIAVLGDSYAEALQVDFEQTFWRVMARDLEGCAALAGRRVEVINFGVSGYGTAQELLMLRRRALRYAPDVVLLLFTTGNDVRNNSKPLQRGGRPYASVQDGKVVFDMSFLDKASSRWKLSWAGRLYYTLRRRSRVVQLLASAQNLSLRGAEPAAAPGAGTPQGFEPGLDDEVYREPADPLWRDAWNLSEALLLATRDEAAAHGAIFALATGSQSAQVHPDPAVREAFAKALGVPDLLRPDRRLEAFAAREKIPFLMLVPPLRAFAEQHGTCVHGFSQDPCTGHWNADGHRVAGQALAPFLCAEVIPRMGDARAARE